MIPMPSLPGSYRYCPRNWKSSPVPVGQWLSPFLHHSYAVAKALGYMPEALFSRLVKKLPVKVEI